ncbi:hypothetical protein DFJ74DRAFT_712910 [Hyaloraphidium curvatum]|nr:hypothetical protein DFJ74DRAFT_712910 [Hyaloraphidium curvatum]
MPRYYLLTASHDHILAGIAGGFIQQRNPGRIEKLRAGDRVVLYAAKKEYGGAKALDKAAVLGGPACAGHGKGGHFFRKKVAFAEGWKEADIKGLVPRLGFVKNKQRWGFAFMSGWREIPEEDFRTIMATQGNRADGK